MISIPTKILMILSQGITNWAHSETTVPGYGIPKLTAHCSLLHSNCFCWVLSHQPKTLSCTRTQVSMKQCQQPLRLSEPQFPQERNEGSISFHKGLQKCQRCKLGQD